jgi:transcription termination/antitermination protein NusG
LFKNTNSLTGAVEIDATNSGLEVATDNSWFALYVRPRHEKKVAQLLDEKGILQFLPLYRTRNKWADRMKTVELPLFAGYLFARFDPHKKLPILTTPGVLAILGDHTGPTPVKAEEFSALQRLVETDLSYDPLDHLAVGDAVRVDAGPLTGVIGSIVEFRRTKRLAIAISLLQRSVVVEIDMDWITPLTPKHYIIS